MANAYILNNEIMKSRVLFFMLITLTVCFTGCKDDDDSLDEPKKPYFYVEYYGLHWATVHHEKLSTMTITDENGQKVNYTIGSRNVVIGPVYAGFKATLTISAPYDGANDGRIGIARNQDHYFTTYGSFSGAKGEETLTYTILEDTGKY